MNEYFILILVFQFIDIITGVFQAFYVNKFSSAQLKKGVFGKIIVWLAIVTSFFIQEWLNVKLLNYVCNMFIGYEVMSIIENLGKLDVNMNIFPENVKNILLSFQVVNKEINKKEKRKETLNNEIDEKIKLVVDENKKET